MSIQLLSISHKTAPVSVREHFTFDETSSAVFLGQLKASEGIEEVVLLSTCNRTEIYCSGEKDSRNLKKMQELLCSFAGIGTENSNDYILRYTDRQAVHHLFKVAAGLDSAMLGESQILGQVKRAFFLADQMGMCGKTFHVLFQNAIAAAKDVSTNTVFARTPVSSATLALKQMQKEFGTLEGKKILLIGASGELGNLLFKDALDMDGLEIYLTTRQEMSVDDGEKSVLCNQKKIHGRNRYYFMVPYRDRYLWAARCDIVVSATRSPHFTIQREKLAACLESEDVEEGIVNNPSGTDCSRKLFFDLAVPHDMEETIQNMEYITYYSLEDMEALAEKNNARKQNSITEAKEIIKLYEETFFKEEYYRREQENLGRLLDTVVSGKEGVSPVERTAWMEKKLRQIFFHLKKEMDSEEFKHFLEILEKY